MTLAEYWESLNKDLDRFMRQHPNPTFSSSESEDEIAYKQQLKALNVMASDGPKIQQASIFRQLSLGNKLDEDIKAALGGGKNPSATVCGPLSKKLAESVYLPHLKRYASVTFSSTEMTFGGSIIMQKREQAAKDAEALAEKISAYERSLSASPQSSADRSPPGLSPVSDQVSSLSGSMAPESFALPTPTVLSPTERESASPPDTAEEGLLFFLKALFDDSEPLYTGAKNLSDILNPEQVYPIIQNAIDALPFAETTKAALKQYQKEVEDFTSYKSSLGSYLFRGPSKPELPHIFLKRALADEYLLLLKRVFETTDEHFSGVKKAFEAKIDGIEKGLGDFLKQHPKDPLLDRLIGDTIASIRGEKELDDSFTPKKLYDLLMIIRHICEKERPVAPENHARHLLALDALLEKYINEITLYCEQVEKISAQPQRPDMS